KVLAGALTLGGLVAFLQYGQRFFRPISDMSEKFNVLQSAMASSERIFRVLDEPVAIESARRAPVSAAQPAAPELVAHGPAKATVGPSVPTGRRGRVPGALVRAISPSSMCGSPTTSRTGYCGTCRSRCAPGSGSGSWAPPAQERRR